MNISLQINDLKNKPIKPLLWQYALPAIIGSSVNAIYNIISRFFIGNADYLGDAAMSAVGIALPIMIIIAAFGMLVGVGSATRISIFMGRNDYKSAEIVLGNALLLLLLLNLPLTFFLLYFLHPIVTLLGATGETFQHTYDFLLFFLPGSIFSMLCFSFNNMMRASGYPKKAMYTMLMTLVINIIFAPLFIYVFKWGVKGAAFAVVISMLIGTFFVMQHFMTHSSLLKLKKENIRLNLPIVKAVLSIGMSPFLMQLVSSSVVFILIHQIHEYGGEVGVAAYTIINGMLMLFVMVVIGLTQGMQPIVGYSYGAGEIKRMKEIFIYTLKIGVVIGIVGGMVGFFAPQYVILPFDPSPALADVSIDALKTASLMFPLVGFQIVTTSFFQSIGKVTQSIFLSLSRQLFFLIPAVIILPHYWGLHGIWLSIPIADFLAAIITFILLFLQFRVFREG